ncbi:Ger(x)C family spore germination protein [Alkalihalobacterium sp. APHAB7]|uniref:Ger(x)C family spore germination protein n=1 Tax=Alkalihalobacterium sp. APHAB7 TaxID=3402081 RepID=UPI003AADA2A7
MKKNYKILVIICLCVVYICGCTDVKEIQHLSYATAIGVDYKDGKYHSYIQLVSFEGIARTEGQTSEGSVWVSEAVADTFEDSFFVVYKTAQERIIWAHVTTILLSETAIEKGFDNIFDSLTRYYEFRLTPWVFGTNESVEKVLSTPGFFGQTTLDTILHAPKRIYEQSSVIRPIKLQRLAREIFEPAETTYVASVAIDNTTWEKDQVTDPKIALNGAFFIKNDEFKGFYETEKLNGLRWLTPETVRADVAVQGDNEDIEYHVVFEYPSANVDLVFIQNTPKFNIELDVTGYFVNRNVNETIKLQEIEKKTKETITDEIMKLYLLGVEEGVDFYNLEHELFRKNFPTWQRLKKNGDPILTETSLHDISINLTIEHTGVKKNPSVDMKDIR